MFIFQDIGLHFIQFTHTVYLFFIFLGHLFHSFFDFLRRRFSIYWFNVVKILYYSGAAIVLPLIVIVAITGISLGLSVQHIIKSFHLQNDAMAVTAGFLTQDVLPMLIGLILCIQSALNIITARIRITEHSQTPEQVVFEHIFPILIGTNFAALMLFTYTVLAVFASLYITFHTILNLSMHEFLSHIERTNSLPSLFFSASKSLAFSSIVSLTAGYYYYQLAIHQTSLRKAVSRILTRGIFWLVISSTCIKLITL